MLNWVSAFSQEKAARLPPIEEVRTFLHHSSRGFLSTFSQVTQIDPLWYSFTLFIFSNSPNHAHNEWLHVLILLHLLACLEIRCTISCDVVWNRGSDTEESVLFLINGDLTQKHKGYPSGSMVDFASDAHGSPIIAVSNLALHTKVCITIFFILHRKGFHLNHSCCKKFEVFECELTSIRFCNWCRTF